MPRLATLLAVLVLLSATAASTAPAATSPWATRANAVCTTWHKKGEAIFGTGTTPVPKTAKALYAFMVKARSFEAGMLRSLRAIAVPRPPAATRALALAAADLHELDVSLAAYRAGNKTAFTRGAFTWLADEKAGKALVAAGARACA